MNRNMLLFKWTVPPLCNFSTWTVTCLPPLCSFSYKRLRVAAPLSLCILLLLLLDVQITTCKSSSTCKFWHVFNYYYMCQNFNNYYKIKIWSIGLSEWTSDQPILEHKNVTIQTLLTMKLCLLFSMNMTCKKFQNWKTHCCS